MSSGSCVRLGVRFTRCRRRTTPAAALTGNMPTRRPAGVPRRTAGPADPDPASSTVRLRRGARRHRALRVPWPGRRSLSAQQVRPARLPPSLRRPVSPRDRPARPVGHRRRIGMARCPGGHLAVGPARHGSLHSTARPGHREDPRGRPARLLASRQARANAPRAQAQPQDMDG
jgi:hypothetical protein